MIYSTFCCDGLFFRILSIENNDAYFQEYGSTLHKFHLLNIYVSLEVMLPQTSLIQTFNLVQDRQTNR